MTGFNRSIGLAMAVLALAVTARVAAQENLDSGKTGAQLYAADCAICHKSPQALNKSGGLFGLSTFLREHYTASRESAATIANYLQSIGNAPAANKRTGASKHSAKGDEKTKSGEEKAKVDGEKMAKPKTDETKSKKSDKTRKPEEAKSSEPKTEIKPEHKPEQKTERKTGAPKAAGSKDKDAKTSPPKTVESKAKDAKTPPPKTAKDKKKPDAAATAKPDKPDKSD
ncbi:MAG: hypothetical protein ABSF41_00720 [Pseudolabrys sp.]